MELTIEAKLRQLEKILQSRTLHGSENLKAFLRFVVEKSVNDKEPQLREHLIATQVFGRASTYDSRTDSVVRVQAGRLRAKLSEYYAHEGQSDTVKIELPKGHYCPAFSLITRPEEISETPASTQSTIDFIATKSIADSVLPPAARPLPLATTTAAPRGFWPRASLIALGATTLLFALLALKFALEARQLRSLSQSPGSFRASSELQILSPLWGEFFKSTEPTLVAYSNTIFQGRPETGMKLLNSLDAGNSERRHQQAMSPATAAQPIGDSAVSDHYTGVGEVMGIYFLGELFRKAEHTFRVKRSLLLTWDDIKNNNLVILGSPAENLLLRELPQAQDFVFKVVGQDSAGPVYGIMNLKPQPGEQEVYVVKEDGPSSNQVTEDYALVTLLKGLDDQRRLLILAGIKTYGTQAATEYVTRPESFKELFNHLKPSANSLFPACYQILLKVKVNDGVPVQTFYVTHHVLD